MEVSFIEIRQVFNDVRQVCANKETFVKHVLFFSYETKVQIRWPFDFVVVLLFTSVANKLREKQEHIFRF